MRCTGVLARRARRPPPRPPRTACRGPGARGRACSRWWRRRQPRPGRPRRRRPSAPSRSIAACTHHPPPRRRARDWLGEHRPRSLDGVGQRASPGSAPPPGRCGTRRARRRRPTRIIRRVSRAVREREDGQRPSQSSGTTVVRSNTCSRSRLRRWLRRHPRHAPVPGRLGLRAGGRPAPGRSPSSARACSAATGSRRCSASPARARAPPSPGRSSSVQRPTLILAPNKSLAAQLAQEMREFFPEQPGRVLRQLLRLLPARGVHRRPATPTSRRTRRSTTRSTGCATRPRPACSPAGTSSSSPRSAASTAWATPRSTRASCSTSTSASTTTSAASCAASSTCSSTATT